jgi:hypothetical protein
MNEHTTLGIDPAKHLLAVLAVARDGRVSAATHCQSRQVDGGDGPIVFEG